MQKMRADTLRKCEDAVILVYEKGYSLRAAAKSVGISSQTIYVYLEDCLSKNENLTLRSISHRNSSRRS